MEAAKTYINLLQKAPIAIKVNEEHIKDPAKIADAFTEYVTSLNVTSEPPEGPVTTKSELDALLLNVTLSIHRINSSFSLGINDEVQFCIPPITKEIIEADLKKTPSNKAKRIDGISIRILKDALQAISPSLAHVYNTSISQGVFPATFKEAKVTPLHKKDSPNGRGNYRPISVLPILSIDLWNDM